MKTTRHALFALALSLAGLLSLSGCVGGKITRVYQVYTGGDPQRGVHMIQQYRCGVCHTIPGVRDARGQVGPPLNWFALRTYIGGEAPNTPENLVHWIQDPQSIEPGTAMPKLGVSEQDARDIAAYLYTLH